MTPEVFETKVKKMGCWEWQLSLTPKGYGSVNSMGEQRAHRLAWRIYKGEIKPGAMICHTCDNRRCVNPEHLYEGDGHTNLKDAYDRNRRKEKGSMTHCWRGHEYDELNTYWYRGQQFCRKCNKLSKGNNATRNKVQKQNSTDSKKSPEILVDKSTNGGSTRSA